MRAVNSPCSLQHARAPQIARFALALIACIAAPFAARAQQTQETPTEEFVANLATGRVMILVAKDAIIIATVENPIEAQTHVPTPIAVTSTRAEIMLGAVDWISPSSQVQLARLDRELPHLRGAAALKPGSLGGAQNGNEATDLEGVGQAVFERFNEVTRNIHGRIDLAFAGEPIAQIVVAGFAKDYGPEVWLLTFDVEMARPAARRLLQYSHHAANIRLSSGPRRKGPAPYPGRISVSAGIRVAHASGHAPEKRPTPRENRHQRRKNVCRLEPACSRVTARRFLPPTPSSSCVPLSALSPHKTPAKPSASSPKMAACSGSCSRPPKPSL